MLGLQPRDEAVATLLRLIADPTASRELSLEQWDRVVRVGRASRLLAMLALRCAERGVLADIPPPVRSHFDSEAAVARYRKQMALRNLHQIASVLEPIAGPVVLLKGAAYIVQGLRIADGRTVSDVDLLVPRERLAAVEARLVGAGWATVDVDPYDERYYREWSHEVPPMRLPGHALELDLHYAILPPIARVTADPAPLFAASRPVEGSMFRVLCPEDQVVHACVHTFVDSDLADRLRDIVDLDGLLREFAGAPGFWDRLCRRAAEMGLGRGFWYGLRYASRLVSTPVPEAVWTRLAAHAPGGRVTRLMDWLVVGATPPLPTDRRPAFAARVARWLGSIRYFWIRMPLPILLRHAAVKGARRLLPKTASVS
jgi:hypothetical protein